MTTPEKSQARVLFEINDLDAVRLVTSSNMRVGGRNKPGSKYLSQGSARIAALAYHDEKRGYQFPDPIQSGIATNGAAGEELRNKLIRFRSDSGATNMRADQLGGCLAFR